VWLPILWSVGKSLGFDPQVKYWAEKKFTISKKIKVSRNKCYSCHLIFFCISLMKFQCKVSFAFCCCSKLDEVQKSWERKTENIIDRQTDGQTDKRNICHKKLVVALGYTIILHSIMLLNFYFFMFLSSKFDKNLKTEAEKKNDKAT
jgi:hypothetical protein